MHVFYMNNVKISVYKFLSVPLICFSKIIPVDNFTRMAE